MNTIVYKVVCLLRTWRVTRKRNLTLSDVESMVTEAKYWKINTRSVVTFYRGSEMRTDELKEISEKLRVF